MELRNGTRDVCWAVFSAEGDVSAGLAPAGTGHRAQGIRERLLPRGVGFLAHARVAEAPLY